ncbi:uncharacterized protein LOC124354200 isoform X2 [Homalodisca vitripennis]|uniref:uncharacterized protein LOC124354200 isoform X2 n=1 Tax=Homalodisca vitripennis TaxID=197043 RepID=UPI001EECBBEA|nr:uncharacterized protein LOC124354200 isoform X2 [Homalodisca vitripennis]
MVGTVTVVLCSGESDRLQTRRTDSQLPLLQLAGVPTPLLLLSSTMYKIDYFDCLLQIKLSAIKDVVVVFKDDTKTRANLACGCLFSNFTVMSMLNC